MHGTGKVLHVMTCSHCRVSVTATTLRTLQEKLKAAAATKKSDKMEAMLREERAKAQREMAALKSQLQDSKTHIHQLKLRECHIPEMKAEFDRERATLQNELTALKAVLEDTKKELEREVELRHMIENDIFISKQGMFSRAMSPY